MNATYDVVVVGAGPYGLSVAAHLRGKGLEVGVFGRVMEMWREHMPAGMLLRSHPWATHISDPQGKYGIERFCEESKSPGIYPVPIQTFIDYGRWFQERAVPEVTETYVSSIERRDGQFQVTLLDGQSVRTRRVVMAIGLYYYAHWPELYTDLPDGLVSHSSQHADFRRFQGKEVMVVGGGQSAIEYAALLQESGARVEVVSRRPLLWLDRDRSNERTWFERIKAPDAGIAAGWDNWVLDHAPYLFWRFPQKWKDSYNSRYQSGATDWLRNRVIGKAKLRERQTVTKLEAVGGKLHTTISDGSQVRVDHLLLATGFRTDVNKLAMLHPALRAELRTDRTVPVLSHWFESSVPGLYFVGHTTIQAFGPLFRFVAGCPASARRVAHAVARG